MQRALGEMTIEGVETTVLLHQVVLEDEVFKSGKHTTDFITSRGIIQKVQERARILQRLSNR
jgi:pyruvate carboxylase